MTKSTTKKNTFVSPVEYISAKRVIEQMALERMKRSATRKNMSLEQYVDFLEKQAHDLKLKSNEYELNRVKRALAHKPTMVLCRPKDAQPFFPRKETKDDVVVDDQSNPISRPVIKYVLLPVWFVRKSDELVRDTRPRFQHIAKGVLEAMRALTCKYCGHSLEAHQDSHRVGIETLYECCVQCSCHEFVPVAEQLTLEVLSALKRAHATPFRTLLYQSGRSIERVACEEKSKFKGIHALRKRRAKEARFNENRREMKLRYEAILGFTSLFDDH